MKITNTEKQMVGVVIAIMILMTLVIGGLAKKLETAIKDNGGLKQIVIDAGKEVKSIGEEIAKD